MPLCGVCKLSCSGINNLHLHLRFVHKLDSYGVHKCGEIGCFKTCSNWKKFREHLKSFHHFPNHGLSCNPSALPLSGTCDNNTGTTSIAVCDSGTVPADSDLPVQNIEHSSSASRPVALKDQVHTYAAHLISKLHAKAGANRKLVQDFVTEVSEFVSSTISSVQSCVNESLKESNVDQSVTLNINTMLDTVKDPFDGLNTEYQRLKYLKTLGYYIEACDYNIAPDMFSKTVGNRVIVEIDNATGKFVPLRKVLKAFLELPNVFHIVLQALESQAPAGLIPPFNHGSHWQKKKLNFKGKVVVPIDVYYDEFEVDKDIGNHSANLGAVYYRISCLPSEYQGVTENIFLAMLFSNVDRVDYGPTRVFQILLNELSYLQSEGIEIKLQNGDCQRVYFALGLIMGDNLGLHFMLAFTESFSANYPCRFCHVHKKVLQTQCFEDSSLLRNSLQHKIDIQASNITETGVAGKSVFHDLEYFDPTENPSVDLMHDWWEGCCVYDMQHILHSLVYDKKYFDVDTLNFRLLTFYYSPEITNKPPQFKEKHVKDKKIKLTASEMKTFVRIFAVLIGDLVPRDDEVWEFFLTVRDISDILLCRSVQIGICVVLKAKIAHHHTLYVQLFSDSLKPKHHHLVHYPSIIQKSGCVANYSCDRFESKHQPSVRNAKATFSRRNIAHTLAMKEQLALAYRLMSRKSLELKLEFGPEENHQRLNVDVLPESFRTDYVAYSYVNYKGTLYKRNMCVVSQIDEDGGPHFGIISAFLVNSKGDVCVVYENLVTVAFSEHFHSYLVTKTSVVGSILLCNVIDHVPVLFSWGCDGRAYVTLHHTL